MKIRITLTLCGVLIFYLCNPAQASLFKSRITIKHAISFPHYPVVLKGSDVLPLSGVPVDSIGLLSVQGDKLKPMIFQIDVKDENNQFVFEENNIKQVTAFDDNDEIVFLAKDAGSRLNENITLEKGSFVTEIEFEDFVSGEKKWIYAVSYSNSSSVQKASTDRVHYNYQTDSIWSDKYRIQFSKQIPFLVDSFNWSSPTSKSCCPNIIDSMKVRHTGQLFGMFDFERTHRDYNSKVLAIKDGPVRVIRRTKNSVHILFGYHSPVILIDFIAYPNAVFMDTHVNFPFRLGLVLSDIKTYMTVDLDSSASLPRSTIYSESTLDGSEINGVIDESDRRFNESGDKWLTLTSEYGSLMAGLALDPGMPVNKRVYMMDDLTQEDPPEDIKGLFGNIGYLTENWEAVDGGIHHMLFGIYLTDKTEPKKSFEILIDAPWPM